MAERHTHGREHPFKDGPGHEHAAHAHDQAAHAHGHAGHHHAGHGHSHAAGADERRIASACLIIVAFLALQVVGGAQRGKAVIILNPADPPIHMRNTVYCLVEGNCHHADIGASIAAMIERVQR